MFSKLKKLVVGSKNKVGCEDDVVTDEVGYFKITKNSKYCSVTYGCRCANCWDNKNKRATGHNLNPQRPYGNVRVRVNIPKPPQ